MSDNVYSCTHCHTALVVRAHRLLPDKCPNCGEKHPASNHFKLFREAEI